MSTTTPNSTQYFYYICHDISTTCPVEATTLGYYPNKGINIFFAVGFALAAAATVVFGVWKSTWGYMAFLAAGSALELAGRSSFVRTLGAFSVWFLFSAHVFFLSFFSFLSHHRDGKWSWIVLHCVVLVGQVRG
jgi:hypothetical protein